MLGRTSGGAGPTNPCGTGASYPAGWRFVHDEISGGLGSWGNMLKVNGFNSFGATIENVTDGSSNFCYKDGEIDKAAMDAFFTGNADVEFMYDQLGNDDLIDGSAGFGYITTDNDLNFDGTQEKTSSLNPSGIASKNIGDAWSACYVLNYPSLPTVNRDISLPNRTTTRFRLTWSGNGVDLIARFQSPNQGYFYSGLRASGIKFLVVTYDGTSPINRSGINLYWNNSTAETPNGSYNGGAPTSVPFSSINIGLPNGAGGYFYEFDFFDHALTPTEVATIMSIYEQIYTFS